MTKKHVKSKKVRRKRTFLNPVKQFVISKRVHFIIGILICFFTIYIGVAMVSYFFTGESDQSVVQNLVIKDVISKKEVIANWAGLQGAYLADVIINRWFGIPTIFLVFLLGSIGVKCMHIGRINLIRRFLIYSLLTIWSSLLLAFVFSLIGNRLFFYAGGRHGQMLTDVLTEHIGFIGVILVLITGCILIAVIISARTVSVIQDKLTIKKKDKAGQGDDEEEEEEEEEEDEEEDDESDEEMPAEVNPVVPVQREESKKPVKPSKTKTPPSSTDDFTIEVAKGDDAPYHGQETGVYDPCLDLSGYKFPTIGLLKKYDQTEYEVDITEQNENQKRIKKTLEDFQINIISIKATVGPTITLYEVVPDKGVRISKIRNLEDDIALSLSALGIRIIAPMPGKGTIGIEVPNKKPQIVSMESVIASRKFSESKYELPVVLGRTITNEVFMFDLTKMPHLLVAGATGQGKSVGLNAIITSLLYKKHPAELKLVLIDPKMVEFNIYDNIERHYLAKMTNLEHAIITDFSHVIDTLKSLCKEMDDRYDLLMKAHVRNISEYNAKFINRHLNPEKGHKYMPYIVVIIDEFCDLIMTAGKEIEMPIARIAQKARAVGMHMIIATQRPSTNIITGTIKANFPARIAFKVPSMIDSRTILDSPGANKLVGHGDLLFSQGNEMTRVQCALIDTDEIDHIVSFIGNQTGFETAYKLPEAPDPNQENGSGAVDLTSRDPLFDDAARLVVIHQQGSTSHIQRKFAIGYNRAGRLMDQLEAAGIVGPFDGSKGRQVLITDEYTLEQILNHLPN